MANTPGRLYRITGRVQGVGFRWWTRNTALELGLSGWVCNLVDGRVECHATGSILELEAFEQRLAQGPRAARVTDVEVTDFAGPQEPPVSGFEVRR